MLTHKHYIYKSSTHIVDHSYINNARAPTLYTFAPIMFVVWLWDWYQILRCMHGPLRSNPIYLLVHDAWSSLKSSSSLIWASKFPHTSCTQTFITVPTRHNSELTESITHFIPSFPNNSKGPLTTAFQTLIMYQKSVTQKLLLSGRRTHRNCQPSCHTLSFGSKSFSSPVMLYSSYHTSGHWQLQYNPRVSIFVQSKSSGKPGQW